MHYEVKFPVRYYETDQMKVVHHSNYIRYFEMARNGMMEAAGLPVEVCENEIGVLFAVIGVECRFKHSARMGDVLTATAAVEEIPMAKLHVKQSVVNQRGEVCAEGTVTLAFLDARTYRPIRCPEPVARLIESRMND
jgi:acyl-CoA thioester hydrolase